MMMNRCNDIMIYVLETQISYKRFFNIPLNLLSNDLFNFHENTKEYFSYNELLDYYASLRFRLRLKPEFVITK